MAGTPTRFSPEGDIDAFLEKAARTARPGGGGRLIFALDATASREPTWDRASHLQAEMFQTAAALGGLEVQLVFYRGFRECKASGWVKNAGDLLKRMLQIRCYGGLTQIGRVLTHAAKETNRRKVDALVFVGDAFEEDIDRVSHEAGKLGMLGTPAFLFQEGGDPLATRGFNEIARLTGGACCRFDTGSAEQLRALLRAVAAFAAGGRAALTSLPGSAAKQLAGQMKALPGGGRGRRR